MAGDTIPPYAVWRAAVEGTSWIPVRFARYELPFRDAALRLRLTEAGIEHLVAAGLPSGGPGGGFVDANDIFNLALDAGASSTLPAIGFRGALRWLCQPVGRLTGERRWGCAFTVQGTAGGPVLTGLPSLRVHEGTWCPEPGTAEPRNGRSALPPGGTVHGVATLRGRREPVRSKEIRECVHAVLEAGLRWAKLPHELQKQADTVASLGYATCVSVSLALTKSLSDAGFEVRNRRGYLIAPVGTAHSWVEVVDEDGLAKAVDPVLVLLRRRLDALEPGTGAPTGPEFELADGLFAHRVLPSALAADEALAVDRDGTPVELTTAFRTSSADGADHRQRQPRRCRDDESGNR